MKETGESSLNCPRCGTALPADAVEGLCPRCLIAMNLATRTQMTGEDSRSADAGAHSSQPPDPKEIGKYFPQLEILECLGRGGMGVVYKARQPKLNRFVALKILAPGKEKDPKFAERFELEAQALAKLDHPNIVTVHDFGETDGLYYLLMEFVDGVNLRQLLRNGHGKLKPQEALAIVPHICEALQYAHDHGVVHRDIKPENVLMDKEGRVKIADFGIAKILGRESSQGVPPSGDAPTDRLKPELQATTGDQAIGTPQYMAPEQMENSLAVDHRSDIYSLGVVFYEMLTGELPVGKFPVPSRKVQVDVRLDEVVLHALEKAPEMRYQTATQLKTEVETIAERPDANKPAAKSGMVRILEIFFGITFTSPLAIRTANLSALGFLGCLGFLAFITLPPTRIFFALFGFFGFFGMTGLAFLFEFAARSKARKPTDEVAQNNVVSHGMLSWLTAARWTARILGALLLAFYATFVLAEGLPAIATQPGGVQLNFAALALMLAGFVVGWWREGTAAFFILAGWTLWHISESHFYWNFFQTPLLVAALYALCWWATQGRRTAVLAVTLSVLAAVLVLGRLFAPTNVFVRGIVTDASTGTVITNASLTLLSASPPLTDDNPAPNARTGPNGAFRLYVGWYSPRKQLAIDAPGYQTLTTNLGPRATGQRRIEKDFQLRANEEMHTADSGVLSFSPVRQASLISPQGRIAELLDLDTGLWATNTVFGESDRETHAWIRSNKLDVLGVVEHGQIAVLCFDMAMAPVNSNMWEQAAPGQVSTNWNLGQQEPNKITPIAPVTDKTDTWFFRTREDSNGILKIVGQNDDPLGVNIRYKLIQRTSNTNSVPRIWLENVPLRDAIKVFAKQSKLNVVFDPQLELDRSGPDGRPALETMLNLEWENVTAQAALEMLLENYGLELTIDPESGIALVSKKSPGPVATVDADFQAPPPVVVGTIPESGASDVNPALAELRVTFSKPMRDGSWSWSAWGKENYPETTGEPRYLEDGRTCVLPVKLEPGKVYALWLNSEKFKNFIGADGRPAVPYLLIFETKN